MGMMQRGLHQSVSSTRRVSVELAGENRTGVARVLEPGTAEDRLARELLVMKYEPVEHDSLEEWGRTSLSVVSSNSTEYASSTVDR